MEEDEHAIGKRRLSVERPEKLLDVLPYGIVFAMEPGPQAFDFGGIRDRSASSPCATMNLSPASLPSKRLCAAHRHWRSILVIRVSAPLRSPGGLFLGGALLFTELPRHDRRVSFAVMSVAITADARRFGAEPVLGAATSICVRTPTCLRLGIGSPNFAAPGPLVAAEPSFRVQSR